MKVVQGQLHAVGFKRIDQLGPLGFYEPDFCHDSRFKMGRELGRDLTGAFCLAADLAKSLGKERIAAIQVP